MPGFIDPTVAEATGFVQPVLTKSRFYRSQTTVNKNLPFWLATLLAISGSVLIGMAMEIWIYRPSRRLGATSAVLLLTSLGLYVVLQNLVSLLFGDDTQTLRTGRVVESFVVYGAHITTAQLWIMCFAIGLSILVWLTMKFTTFGKSARAVACDPELALVSGVNRDGVILGAFIFGSALAALAGILVSLDVDMTPTMGLNALMMGVVAVIVGGMGSIPGVAVGALLLGMAQHFGVWKIGTEWQDAIAFLILLIFLVCRPHGFFGERLRKESV